MAGCCWEKLPFITPVLSSEVQLRDIKWWDHHEGTVDLRYYEQSGVYTPAVKQASFMGGRPGFVGPVAIDEVNTRGLNTPREDMWASISSALSKVLFHGPYLKREPVFSGGHFARPDFMRTVKTSNQGGPLTVIFVLLPGLWFEPVHVGNDKLGGSSQASEFLQHGQFSMYRLLLGYPPADPVAAPDGWRGQTNWDDILDAWAANENAKVTQNPSTTGFASWRTEVAEIHFNDIAAFGGNYGSISNFYRAFGGQRLQLRLDVNRPPHRHFRRRAGQNVEAVDAVMNELTGRTGGMAEYYPTYTPVIAVDLSAWDTARGLNRLPGEPLPDLPSQAYMTSLAHAAVNQADSTLTIEGWMNKHVQPDGGIMYLWINGERMLYDHNRERDWASFFVDKMQWVNVQDYSPPSAFADNMVTLPADYLSYRGSLEGTDVNTQLGTGRKEEVQDADE